MLVDAPIEPGSCVIRQEGVDLSSQEVVGSDWENSHWEAFRWVNESHTRFGTLCRKAQ